MARISPEKTILERLDEMEKQHKELIAINKELEEKVSKSEKVISESAHEASIMAGMRMTAPEVVSPYPEYRDDRPDYIKEKEVEFTKFGVGVKSIKFVMVGKGDGDNSLYMARVSDKVTYKGRVINMVYARNHESPFVVDHPVGDWTPETEAIIFDRGAIVVPPSDPCLQRYLMSVSNYGKKWKVYDEEELSKAENARFEKMDRAVSEFLGMYSAKDKNSIRYFTMYLLGAHDAVEGNMETLKHKLRVMVMADPDRVDNFDKTQWSIKYLFAYAHAKGFLETRGSTVCFNDGRPICTLDKGLDIYESFYQSCFNNVALLQEIREKVGF